MLLHSNCGYPQNILKKSLQRGWTSSARFDVIAPISAEALFTMKICKICNSRAASRGRRCDECYKRIDREKWYAKNPLPKIEDMPGEEWRDIPNTKFNYRISTMGRIKSLVGREKLLSPVISGRGYYCQMFVGFDGYVRFMVHRVVAEAFIPNPENKPLVNHKNGVKTDNRVENLEWCTQSENIKHAYNTGLIITNVEHLEEYHRGKGNPMSILTEELVKEFRTLHASGMRVIEISHKFPEFKYATIYKVIKREGWKHIV